MLKVSVLGPIEVTRDGHPVPVPGGKTSEVLARLALDAGVLVRADTLLDDLWDGAATQRNTLQAKVARLRRALGDPSLIETTEGGYRLAIAPEAVDALLVLRDADLAASRLDAGDDRGVVDLTRRALEAFRGEVLPASGDWALPYRAQIDAAQLRLLETGFAARLELGQPVVDEIEATVADHPYRERLWELLITALYGAGRQADALDAYQRVRRRLADDLGLDPSPALRELEHRVLNHDPALLPVAAVGNLPSLEVELVGRERELDAVVELVHANRLVEIVGVGGIGKTALALASGRVLGSMRGGVWLVRLEAAQTADEVLDAVIAALEVTGGEAALIERVRRTGGLVIFDNCEHVQPAAARLAELLLDAAPALRMLCTSQMPLEVQGERIFELEPLALDSAVELFALRAARGGAGKDVVELCRSLDGLPLAIELAAARTKTLSIDEISRRLDDRFTVLNDPASHKPERRRALRATIGWSYELLFPDDQRGLWALGAFADGAPLDAVELVLAALDVPASATIDVVGRLASRSPVIVDGATPSRYRLLDSIRAFARDAMDAAEMTNVALGAQAEWLAAASRRSTADVRGAAQAEALAFVRSERANIDAALAWAASDNPCLGLEIANGFGWAWIVLGDSRGGQRILAALEAAGVDAPERDRATALLLAGWVEASTGHLGPALEHVAHAAALAEEIGDRDLYARAAYYRAYVVSHHGEWEEALNLTTTARTIYDELDGAWDQAANALFASRAAISAGDLDRARDARDQIEHWLTIVDDPWLHVRRDAMLGEFARVEHRFDDAVRHIADAAATSARRGFMQTEAYQVSSLGRAQCQAGDYEAGAATLALAIGKAEATGDVRMAALARVHLGRVLRALGRDAEARAALESAAAWHRDAGGGEQSELGECLLAAMDGSEGRLEAIRASAHAADDAPVEVFALDALARIAVDHGDMARAADLVDAADRRMAVASHFISERDRTDRALVALV